MAAKKKPEPQAAPAEGSAIAGATTPTVAAPTPAVDNRRLWDKFGVTNPLMTEKFQRRGGFKGTAIEALYHLERMTNHFGPMGLGWGATAPQYTTHIAGSEILVYCVVGIWYREGDGERSQPVYGIGGDYVVSLTKDGDAKTNDEAYKAAYTDALGNALKHLGMSADVYMGLFDDQKYVDSLKRRFRNEEEQKADADAAKAFEASDEFGWSKDFLEKVEACATEDEVKELKSRQVAEFRRLEAAGTLGKKRALFVANQLTAKLTKLAGSVAPTSGDELAADIATRLGQVHDLEGLDTAWRDFAEKIRASSNGAYLRQMFAKRKGEIVAAETRAAAE
jgi:hypothetical protein